MMALEIVWLGGVRVVAARTTHKVGRTESSLPLEKRVSRVTVS